jgi:hypothetical protein
MDNDINRNDESNDDMDVVKGSIQFNPILGATAAMVGVMAKDYVTNQMGYHCIMNPAGITAPTEMPVGIFYDVTDDKRVILFVDYSTYDNTDEVPPFAPLLTFGESRFLMKQIENLQSFFKNTDFRVDVLTLRIPNDMEPNESYAKILTGYTKDYTNY